MVPIIFKVLTLAQLEDQKDCLVDLSEGCFSWQLAALSTAFWFIALHVIKYTCLFLLDWAHGPGVNADPNRSYLPDELPCPNPPGTPLEWTRKVADASESDVDKFLAFRQVQVPSSVDLIEKKCIAAAEALQYRNELYDAKFYRYMHVKFKDRQPIAFPLMLKSWNPRYWFAELGHGVRRYYAGMFAYACQHAVAGGVAYYALSHGAEYVRLAYYLDIGFNLADLGLMTISNFVKYDLTVFAGWRRMDSSKGDYSMQGIYVLMVAHHFGGFCIETLALAVNIDPDLMAQGAVAMLGTTGLLHLTGVLSDLMPVREWAFGNMVWTTFIFAVMVYYRVILWFSYFFPSAVTEAYSKGGLSAGIVCGLAMSLFTAFNLDFLKFYMSKWKKLYRNYVAEQKSKTL